DDGAGDKTTYFTNVPSGWTGSAATSPLTVTASLSVTGFEVRLSSTSAVFSGSWTARVFNRIQNNGQGYIWRSVEGAPGSSAGNGTTRMRVDSIRVEPPGTGP